MFTSFKILALERCWPAERWEGGHRRWPRSRFDTSFSYFRRLAEMRQRHSLKGTERLRLSPCHAAVSFGVERELSLVGT